MEKNRNPVDSGIVSQCEANDCVYSQKDKCKAGAIYFNDVKGKANCYSFTTEIQQTAPGLEEVGQVAQCSVIDCFYNEVQSCVAKAIKVSFASGIAQCNNYIVSDNDKQI